MRVHRDIIKVLSPAGRSLPQRNFLQQMIMSRRRARQRENSEQQNGQATRKTDQTRNLHGNPPLPAGYRIGCAKAIAACLQPSQCSLALAGLYLNSRGCGSGRKERSRSLAPDRKSYLVLRLRFRLRRNAVNEADDERRIAAAGGHVQRFVELPAII